MLKYEIEINFELSDDVEKQVNQYLRTLIDNFIKDNNITDLSTYGIAFDTNVDSDISTIENFSIQLYKGNNWTSQLYEYHTHDTSSYRLAKFKNELSKNYDNLRNQNLRY